MNRFWQVLLIVTFICFSWLGMQAVHEAGHAIVAALTGAEILKVALHPLIFSHTDVAENPHPSAEVWGGAVLGCLLPLIAWATASLSKAPGVYLF